MLDVQYSGTRAALCSYQSACPEGGEAEHEYTALHGRTDELDVIRSVGQSMQQHYMLDVQVNNIPLQMEYDIMTLQRSVL